MATRVDYTTVDPPAHVSADRIVDFDYLVPAGIRESDVYTALKPLHDLPDICWTPRNGGHWILTRSDDIRWAREEHEIFSHEEFGVPRGAMNVFMPPVTVDPPRHARYRAVLNPAFTPTAARSMTEYAREVAAGLVEELRSAGKCEFVMQFARIMPVTVFLKVLGLSTERRDDFVRWAVGYTSAKDQETKDRSADAVAEFLAAELDKREANPGEDLLSRIVAFRQNPRFEGEFEVMGMAMVSFIGGLDTLSNMMSFTAWHLATHPDLRRKLVEQPDLIPQAAEELIRRFGLTMTGRLIKRDVTRKGARMKAGEMALVVDPLAGIDERAWPDPFEIDIARASKAHDTFGNSAHKCVGEHLARVELIVFLEEWLKRIPEFGLDPEVAAISYSGPVIGMTQLGMVW